MNLQDQKIAIKKFKSKIKLELEFSNLYILSSPEIKELSNKIYTETTGGQLFRDNLFKIGNLFSQIIENYITSNKINSITIAAIPRGAIPFAKGIKKTITYSQLFYIKNKVNKKPLLKKSVHFAQPNLFVLVDTVVDTGNTAEWALRFICNNYKDSNIILTSLITAADGAFRLEKTFPQITHYTSMITTEVSWIKSTKNINQRIIPKIGDVGELVSKE